MLRQSANSEVGEAAVLRQFALTFPHERPQRIMGTVVAWTRYAGLFVYGSTRKAFFECSNRLRSVDSGRYQWETRMVTTLISHKVA